jgi:hypothetical protein
MEFTEPFGKGDRFDCRGFDLNPYWMLPDPISNPFLKVFRAATAGGHIIVNTLSLLAAASGNLTSLPGLLVHQELPRRHFARIVSLVVTINQFSFAFGPTLLGQAEAVVGSYRLGLVLCLSAEALAAIIVAAPVVLGGRHQGRGVRAICRLRPCIAPHHAADRDGSTFLLEQMPDFDHPRSANSTAVSSKRPQKANRIRL